MLWVITGLLEEMVSKEIVVTLGQWAALVDVVSLVTMAWPVRKAMRGIKVSQVQGEMLALVVLVACLARKVTKERRVRKESGEYLEVMAHVVLKANEVQLGWKVNLASKVSMVHVVFVAVLGLLEALAPLVTVVARVTRVSREPKGVKAFLVILVFKAGRVREVITGRVETRASTALKERRGQLETGMERLMEVRKVNKVQTVTEVTSVLRVHLANKEQQGRLEPRARMGSLARRANKGPRATKGGWESKGSLARTGQKDIKASEAFLAPVDPRAQKATEEWACQVREAKQGTEVNKAQMDQVAAQVLREPLGDMANQGRMENTASMARTARMALTALLVLLAKKVHLVILAM